MQLDDVLVQAAKDFITMRFPDLNSEQGAAAMYTSDGEVLVSTAPEVFNAGAGLCHETGALCDAHKKEKKITASVCVSRELDGTFVILTPCGICQERLYHFGGEIQVAVPRESDITQWEAKLLKEIQPYYWAKPFLDQTK